MISDDEIVEKVDDLSKKLELVDDLKRQNDRNEIAIIKKDEEVKELKQKLEVLEGKEKERNISDWHRTLKGLAKETKEDSQKQVDETFR